MISNVTLEKCISSANTGLDAIKRAPIIENDTGIKCIRIQDISQNKDYVNWGFTEVTVQNFEKFQLKKDDILIARTGGSIGVNRFISEDLQAVYNNGLIRIRVDTNKYYPKFVYYLLRTESFKQHINAIAFSTAAQPNMKIRDFLRFEFFDLDLKQQIYIADMLSVLDDKIQINRQTNQTLEQIAQAIFKSWFVDFEPVKAKIQARRTLTPTLSQKGRELIVERAAMCAISGKSLEELEQLSPETQQQLKTTAAVFPDALVDSELGEIPEGWELVNMKSITTEIRRGISPKYIEENGISVINQKCIRNHTINFELTRLNDPLKRKIDGREVAEGDVLINSTGVGTLGRLAPVRYLPKPMVFDSHVTVVRADTNLITKTYLASLLLSKESFIEASGAGSTGQTELRKQVIEEIMVAKPSFELCVLYEAIAIPINKQIAELEQQRVTLAETRDTLLPKLLSGELTPSPTAIKEKADKETIGLSNA